MTARTAALLLALLLLTAACSSSDDAEDTAEEAAPTTEEEDAAGEEPVTGPASIAAEDQQGDGSSVTVASVTLPTAGFVVIHDGAEGSPGPVIGHSALLPEGDSTDVVVPLDEPLAESGMVFPMAHVDADDDGVYEFFPPDDTTDVPATTADGEVAVLGIDYTVAGDDGAAAADATISIIDFSFGEPITVAAGDTIEILNADDAPHTWTAEDGTFDSGTIAGGESYSTTIDTPGEYAFVCSIHPSMMGSITVEG